MARSLLRETYFYATRYAGILASYSPSGNLNFMVRTIDPSPLPSIWINSAGRWKVEPGSPLKALGLSVSSGKIYILSERESQASASRILDAYSESNGIYLYSIRLSQPVRHSAIVGDTLYTVGEDKVIRWKMYE
jgi:hypothetical protein